MAVSYGFLCVTPHHTFFLVIELPLIYLSQSFIALLVSSLQNISLMADPQRAPTTDFYGILGITKSATIKDMCRSYKSLVMKWHPERNPSNKAEAESKFQEINEAYKVYSIYVY